MAAGLQNKSDKGHTHRAAEITDLAQAVGNLFGADKSANGWVRLPNGLLLQWLCIEHTIGSIGNTAPQAYSFPVAFAQACRSLTVNTCLDDPSGGYGGWVRARTVSPSQFELVEDYVGLQGRGLAAKTYVFAIGS